MMDLILIPLVVGIITLGTYKLFELFVCRKERLMMIEKLSDRIYSGDINSKFMLNLNYSHSRFSFSALKGGCLMLGIGLGLLIGFYICTQSFPYYLGRHDYDIDRAATVVYGACSLLFGGLGLLAAFLIEVFVQKKEKKE